MAADNERKSVERVVLMEFEMVVGALKLPDEVRESLMEQAGETLKEGEKLTVLIPVGRAKGGPRQVVDEVAKTRGRFRAIARESYDQGHEAVPPNQTKFELKPL